MKDSEAREDIYMLRARLKDAMDKIDWLEAKLTGLIEYGGLRYRYYNLPPRTNYHEFKFYKEEEPND